jgi:hypothetical protein
MGTPINPGSLKFTTRQYYLNGVPDSSKGSTLTFEDLDNTLIFLSRSMGNSTINGGQANYLPVWKSSTTLGTGSLKQTGQVITGVSASLDAGINLNFTDNIYKLGTFYSDSPTNIEITDGAMTISSGGDSFIGINSYNNQHYFQNALSQGMYITDGVVYLGRSRGTPNETKGILIELNTGNYPKVTIGDIDTSNPGHGTKLIVNDGNQTVYIGQNNIAVFTAGTDTINNVPYITLPLGQHPNYPNNPTPGMMFFDPNNSTDGTLYIFNGQKWAKVYLV